VAIAMAAYNDQRYLEDALSALEAQTFRDFHITVYDDGSADASASVAESFRGRLSIDVIRGPHLGLQLAKQKAWKEAVPAPYLMMLDSDIVLPGDALQRMTAALDGDPAVAAASAAYRAAPDRPLGGGQAFIDDVFFHSNLDPATEDCRWLIGGCAMLRRDALRDLEVRLDLGDADDLSEKLRAGWRLVIPRGLVAIHYGVPTTVAGIVRRFDREGVRIRAFRRAYPSAKRVGSKARLVPFALVALLPLAALVAGWRGLGGAATLLALYAAAFLWVSRSVPALLRDRLQGALIFTLGNVAYGFGWVREALFGGARLLQEPPRPV
jgi:glycosyltransferase involved in cell wall biosynthesis